MKRVLMVIIFAGLFGFGGSIKAAELPQSACDNAQLTTPHLTSQAFKEPGGSLFKYGSNGVEFVSREGSLLKLSFEMSFDLFSQSTIKLYFMDSNCAIGAGYAFEGVHPASNHFSFDTSSENLIMNGQDPIRIIFNTPARYLWLEIRHGVEATYSYAVDLENLQNPEALEEIPEPVSEVRINPDPVVIIPGILGSQDKNGVWLMDPIMHTYSDLIETFRHNGYEDSYDIFVFPYDWRRSNRETAVALRLQIQEARNLCRCDKVDIVAHSMGGLIAREYIQSDDYRNDIDQIIFLGTPHLGAPKAYKIWEHADAGSSIADKALRFLLKQESKKRGYSDLINYIHEKVVSISELLPIFDYVKENEELNQYPDGHLRNQFLENLNIGFNSFLNLPLRISSFVGALGSESTPRYLSKPESDFEMGEGDGTVPQESGELIVNNLVSLQGVGHSKIPDAVIKDVFYTLVGSNPDTVVDKFRIPDILLIIRMLSPADMTIVTPDGKYIGRGFETGQEINEVEGGFYSGFNTDDEFVTIPDPIEGEYKIVTKGTGFGEYTVATTLISENEELESEVTSTTDFGKKEVLELLVTTQSLNLQRDPDTFGGGGAVREIGEVRGLAVTNILEGSLVLDSSDSKTVYIMSEGKKYGFTSAEVFLGFGFKFEHVKSGDVTEYPEGRAIYSINQAHPKGSLIFDGQTIWLVQESQRQGFETMEQFVAAGFNLDQVVLINKYDWELKGGVYGE